MRRPGGCQRALRLTWSSDILGSGSGSGPRSGSGPGPGSGPGLVLVLVLVQVRFWNNGALRLTLGIYHVTASTDTPPAASIGRADG